MDKLEVSNLLAGLPAQALAEEQTTALVERPGLRIERIVSTGQATPQGEWYDLEAEEWVLLVRGERASASTASRPTGRLRPAISCCCRRIAAIA